MTQSPTAPAPPAPETTRSLSSPTAAVLSFLVVVSTVVGLAIWVPRLLEGTVVLDPTVVGSTLSGFDRPPWEALARVAWPAVLALGVPVAALVGWGVAMRRAAKRGRLLTAMPVIVASACLAPGLFILLPDVANAATHATRAAAASNTDFPTAEETLAEQHRLLELLRDDIPLQGAEIELSLYADYCIRPDGKVGEMPISEIAAAGVDDRTSHMTTTAEMLELEGFDVQTKALRRFALVVGTDARPQRRIVGVQALFSTDESYIRVRGACVVPGAG